MCTRALGAGPVNRRRQSPSLPLAMRELAHDPLQPSDRRGVELAQSLYGLWPDNRLRARAWPVVAGPKVRTTAAASVAGRAEPDSKVVWAHLGRLCQACDQGLCHQGLCEC
jgi:hypothetical protein